MTRPRSLGGLRRRCRARCGGGRRCGGGLHRDFLRWPGRCSSLGRATEHRDGTGRRGDPRGAGGSRGQRRGRNSSHRRGRISCRCGGHGVDGRSRRGRTVHIDRPVDRSAGGGLGPGQRDHARRLRGRSVVLLTVRHGPSGDGGHSLAPRCGQSRGRDGRGLRDGGRHFVGKNRRGRGRSDGRCGSAGTIVAVRRRGNGLRRLSGQRNLTSLTKLCKGDKLGRREFGRAVLGWKVRGWKVRGRDVRGRDEAGDTGRSNVGPRCGPGSSVGPRRSVRSGAA